jgi:hypothetical protein
MMASGLLAQKIHHTNRSKLCTNRAFLFSERGQQQEATPSFCWCRQQTWRTQTYPGAVESVSACSCWTSLPRTSYSGIYKALHVGIAGRRGVGTGKLTHVTTQSACWYYSHVVAHSAASLWPIAS